MEGAREGLAFEDGVALDCCPPKVAAFAECLQRRRPVKIKDRQVTGRMMWVEEKSPSVSSAESLVSFAPCEVLKRTEKKARN